MKLWDIEIAGSGKKIKRRLWGLYDYISNIPFSPEDIRADDWEVEPDPVPVKRKVKWEAWMFDDLGSDESRCVKWVKEGATRILAPHGVTPIRIPSLDQEVEER